MADMELAETIGFGSMYLIVIIFFLIAGIFVWKKIK